MGVTVVDIEDYKKLEQKVADLETRIMNFSNMISTPYITASEAMELSKMGKNRFYQWIAENDIKTEGKGRGTKYLRWDIIEALR